MTEKVVDIDAINFDCSCPKCGHETGKTAAFIRQYSQYVCDECDVIVPIVDRREILQAIAVGEKVIELAKTIRKPESAA